MIGQAISHYKVLERLGAGGMGVVYKAQDLKLDRFVVLKFLSSDLTRDEKAKERFIVEAKAASALDHPNVCTIYEINETDDGQLFIAMAYYDGETLKEKVASGQLSVVSVVEIATQIAQGLSRAHEAGIVHRDIKPANVVITKRHEVKILDFGLAKLAGQQHLTKSGATLGTIAYMSPQQAQGLEVDHRTDIWSLGVVMYEMLTGQLPFQGHYDQAVMYSIVNVSPAKVRGLRSDVSERLEAIVEKALAKKLEERYQQVDELLEDLKSPTKKIASQPAVAAPKFKTTTKRYLYGSLLVLIMAMIGAGIYLYPKPKQTIHSIAVLPLENLTGDAEQEYFADGMTEALIANLAKIKSLRVISRTSVMTYKNARKPLPEIAKELNVDAVVEGSVALAEGRVRVTAQLIDALSDRHLWADNYDRNLRDVLVLQSEVTNAIVEELRVQLAPEEQQRITNVRPVDAEAYQLYLKGREYFANDRFNKGIESFQQAISLEPSFAPAYASLAMSYLWARLAGPQGGAPPRELFPRAKAAASKALALDGNLGEAYAALAMVKFFYDWDWDSPEEEFKRALDLDPQNTIILIGYYGYLSVVGRFDEGINVLHRAIAIDPLSPYGTIIGRAYGLARRYDESIATMKPLLEIYPNNDGLIYQMGWNCLFTKRYQEALAFADKGPTFHHRIYIYARAGNRNKALQVLDELHEFSKHKYHDPFWTAVAYIGLGDYDEAFKWLQKAYEERSDGMVFLKVEPALDPIRSDPRYAELCRKIGLK